MSELNATTENAPPTIINKGTGAGGANTNKNGLSYEEITNLSTNYVEVGIVNNGKTKCKSIKFDSYDNVYISGNKSQLHSYMNFINEKNNTIIPAAGCKEPDEYYIDNNTKQLFIIEKKNQNGNGSVDEKLQTCVFKKLHYSKLFPNYKIHYIYCLAEWFNRDEYKSVRDYINDNEIPLFWGSDVDYKTKIIKYINAASSLSTITVNNSL
jgi:hypothetical protein